MSKNKKLILILAIIAAVLALVSVYIFCFHTDLSVERRLYIGDSAMEDGNYKKAIRHYNAAWNMHPDDPQIAISLSNAYKASGNYTKAEYTLVSTISQNPDQSALYVALSKTYVEQEKFLDADNVLTRAANETVRKELEAMRPAPPTLSPESGAYNTYIAISATCSAGRVFLSTDGAYPSNKGDLYAAPVELEQGQTTVYALAVDDSGLVSPIIEGVYTIGGVVEDITITDAGLDALVRETLGKAAEDVLMTSDLWSIETLEIGSQIHDLSQLSNFIGLKSLKIKDSSTTDMTFLSKLASLEKLDLSGCVLSEASIECMGKLTALTELNVSACAITDIGTLTALNKLKVLDVSDNVIADITAISQFTELESLDLSNNPVTTLQALTDCLKLQSVKLSNCSLTSLDALSAMSQLTELDVSNNKITTLAPLAQCAKLTKLNVSGNQLTNITVLPSLPLLREFDGSHNQISKIPVFDKDTSVLVSIDMSYNKVSSVEGLKDLSQLNFVILDYNDVVDLSPLANCYNLVKVDAWNNPVSSAGISALTEHSIIVNYNPNF